MTTYDLKDQYGRVFAFEVESSSLSRRGAVRVVRSLPGAHVVRAPKPWRLSVDDYFCEFEYRGKQFAIWEQFGDSDRYWIGPEPTEWTPEVAEIREHFQRTQLCTRGPVATITLLALVALLVVIALITAVSTGDVR